jgi:glycosyltransferase involved in cell wall biosynthesis
MAAGVPVMATDVGANREVLEDGKAGMILPEDEGEWPVLFSGALTPEGEAQAKVRARLAADRVEKEYSMSATLERYEAVYGGG